MRWVTASVIVKTKDLTQGSATITAVVKLGDLSHCLPDMERAAQDMYDESLTDLNFSEVFEELYIQGFKEELSRTLWQKLRHKVSGCSLDEVSNLPKNKSELKNTNLKFTIIAVIDPPTDLESEIESILNHEITGSRF